MNTFWHNKWGLSITAGTLLGLSFPPIDLSFLSIPAFILLFRLSDLCDSNKQLAYYSYPGFVVWNLITTYWLMMASVYAGIAAVLANSVLMTIPLAAARYYSNRFEKPVLIALLQTTVWVSYEYLHHHWDLAWPWLALGNAWANQVSLIQYISITGYLGISFWVIFTAALSYQAIRLRNQRLGRYAMVSFLLLPTLSIISFWGSESQILLQQQKTEVMVIQPNHDSYQDYGGMSGLGEVLDSLFALTEAKRTPDTELIVWPENAIDGVIQPNGRTAKRIADSARAWNTSFIVGTGLIETYDENDQPELFYGYLGDQPYNIFNSSLYITQEGDISYYHKGKLVPVVERFPFVQFFHAVDVFGWIDWGKKAGYGRGKETTILPDKHFITGGLVCYDSAFPSWNRQLARKGAGFITIITNDGWWGNSSGHHQHFAYARLRAIELNRWIVRSANNGTSGIIGPYGRVFKKTDYWVKTGFNFSVPNLHTRTFYYRFGDWLSYLALFVSVAGFIRARFRKPTSNG